MRITRYDGIAMLMHWSSALLILLVFLLGLTVDDFPKALNPLIVNLHAVGGLLILVLALGRLAWRMGHRPPALPPAGALMMFVAKAGHGLLYFLMVAVPLIGLPTLFYRGRGLDFGLFQIPPLAARTPEIFRPLTEIHELASYALIALAAGHILAALYHQFALRDGLIGRMLPARQ